MGLIQDALLCLDIQVEQGAFNQLRLFKRVVVMQTDVDVVLRWFGAQRPPACLVHLPDEQDPLTAAEAIEAAVSGLVDWLAQT